MGTIPIGLQLESSQGGIVGGGNVSNKYYEINFPIEFSSIAMDVLPYDIMAGTPTASSVTPAIIWAKEATSNSSVRFVSDLAFNNTGVGMFGYIAFGR